MKKLLLAFLLAFVPLIGAANSSVSISKNLAAVDSALTVTSRGYNSVSYQLTGTWTATVKFEGTVNGTTWTTVYAVNQKGGAVDSVATANGVYLLSGNGFLYIRARVSAYTSGTAAIQAITNEGSGVVSLLNQTSAGASSNVAVTSSALPTGAATAANLTGGSQKTQVVDGSGNVIGATSNALDVNIKSGASSGAVAQGSTTSGQTGSLTQGAVTTAAPAYTTAQTSPLSLTTGGALRVDASAQTLTVGSHAVTNAGTFAVQAAQSGTWNVTNVSGTVSLPTGAATAAKQPALGTAGASSTDVLSVQGIASGTAMPVSAASLPLPTLASTSTKQSDGSQKTQIVDGSGNVIASTSNNLNVQCANCSGSGASATDAASFTASTSTFAPSGLFYQTTATSNPLTTGQQGMLQGTANRAAHVNLRNASGTEIGTASNPVQVSLANTASNGTAVSVTCSNCSGSGASAVDAATFTAASSSFAPSGAFFQTTATSNPLTTGQQGMLQATAQRALFVNPRNSSGTEIATSTNPYRIDPTGTTTQPVSGTVTANAGSGTMAVSIATAPVLVAGSAIIGKVGIDQTTPGTTNLVALAANQSVNVAQINGVTALMGNGVTGTGSQRVTIASDNTAFSVNATATGAAAHGASVSGAPVLVGGEARTSDGTAVTNGQAVREQRDVFGKAVVLNGCLDENVTRGTANYTNTTAADVIAAAGAGVKIAIYSVTVTNAHATVGTKVELRDGTTVKMQHYAAAAGGGWSANGGGVPLFITTANTAATARAVTTGADVDVTFSGCLIKN